MEEPKRKVKIGRKWHNVHLYPPGVCEVLSKDFDYQKYVERLIKEKIEPESMETKQELADFFGRESNVSEEKIEDEEAIINEKQAVKKRRTLNKAYDESMQKLQCLYEESINENWETDIHINELMRELAEEYLEALSIIDQNYEKKKDPNQSNLMGKIDSLAGVNRLVADVKKQKLEAEFKSEAEKREKERIQQESVERIRAYRNGEIKPADLLGYDIRNLSEGQEERKLRHSARIVINGIYMNGIDLPNYESYTMAQLYSIYKNSEQISPKSAKPSSQGKSR